MGTLLLLSGGCVAEVGELSTELSGVPGDPATIKAGVAVTPSVVDFGVSAPSCPSRSIEGRIIATTAEPLEIEGVELEPSDGVFILEPPSSASVPGGRSVSWTVRTRTAPLGAYSAVLSFRIRLPSGQLALVERSVQWSVDDATRTDRFVQNSRRATDVLFVIDDSASMAPEQAALARNFDGFLRAAEEGLADYHIGVTTTDMSEDGVKGLLVPLPPPPEPPEYKPQPRDGEYIVTRASQPSPIQLFRANAQVGIRGTLSEKGLAAAAAALSEPLASGYNIGFRRPDAGLSLVFVSDEDDDSERPVSYYVDLFRGMVVPSSGARVSASAIIGPTPDGCVGADGGATAGHRYAELTLALGGRVESICTDDWGTTLANLSGVAFGLEAAFVLSAPPRGEPMVTVDGNPRPRINSVGQTVWMVDPATRTLVFAERFTPPEGAVIDITYAVGCPDDGRS